MEFQTFTDSIRYCITALAKMIGRSGVGGGGEGGRTLVEMGIRYDRSKRERILAVPLPSSYMVRLDTRATITNISDLLCTV
jgi:hypothetical protein